jgi:hypothetical protein
LGHLFEIADWKPGHLCSAADRSPYLRVRSGDVQSGKEEDVEAWLSELASGGLLAVSFSFVLGLQVFRLLGGKI